MLTVDPSYYQHPLDRKTLASLKAIPGFTQVLQAFMKVFSERMFFIEYNSTNLRLGPKQVPEVYELLPPIAERLGIPEPRLYLENNRELNAYTIGENEPFIVLQTGLLEAEPLPVIQSVLAHECGHIASHHVLYKMMGKMILGGAAGMIPGLGALISYPLQVAFMEWSRSAEFTADRAAALALGGSDLVVKCCTIFAGGYSSLGYEINQEEFLNQALDYEQAMQASKTNKAFEFLMYADEQTHPLNAYRALSITRWCATQEFIDMNNFLDSQQNGALEPGVDPYSLPVAGGPDTPPTPGDPDSPPPPSGPAVIPDAQNMPARFCQNCGTPAQENSRFCQNCGNPLG